MKIVDRLPDRCPLASPSPIGALWAMQKLAWSGVARFDQDGDELAEGLDLQARCQTCGDCIRRLLAHPRIERLRRAAGVNR